jgi:hypothetical protein
VAVRLLATLLALSAAVLSACAAGAGGSSDGGSPPSDDEFTVPSDGKSIGPVGATVTGTLGFDDIEGGCAFLETADGKRYEVIYPEDWTIDKAQGQLRGPAGEVANAGDTVTVRGSVETGRSSICQIGPIFGATSVEISPG